MVSDSLIETLEGGDSALERKIPLGGTQGELGAKGINVGRLTRNPTRRSKVDARGGNFQKGRRELAPFQKNPWERTLEWRGSAHTSG